MQAPYKLTAVVAALWLAACGGGGDGAAPGAMQAAPAPMLAMTASASSYSWTVADATPRIWHSLSMNGSGDVIVAGEAGGQMHVSRDGGATWVAGNSPTGSTWISSATSATGDRIFAQQYSGAMYVTRDWGATWTPVVSGSNGWEAVTVSQDGLRVAAVVQNGPLMLSSDGGAHWHNAVLPDGVANHWWRWIDSSSDGSVLVAVSQNGEVFRSTDSGASWRAVAIVVNGAQALENWYRVKVSANGQVIAIVANAFGGASGTGIYVSRDGGSTWKKPYSLVADYTFLAMSADGSTIAASVSNTNGTPGRVLWSGDGGTSFSPMAMPGSDTNWRAVVMSSAGDRMAAATGGFNTQSTGLLYTARSSGTAPAPSPTPAPAPSPSPAPTPAPAPAPTCNAPAWNSTTRYMPGDTVTRNGTVYTATAQSANVWNVNSPPEWTPNYWSVNTSCGAPAPAPAPTPAPAPSPTPAPAPAPTPAPAPAPAPAPTPAPSPAPAPSCTAAEWQSNLRYMPGDRVMRLGQLYVSTPQTANVWNVNSPPEWTPNYWAKATC